MTVEDKIAESYYNLDKIRHLSMMAKEFQFELSNYLNSAQSIFYHLLEDYNQKFCLGLTGNYRDDHFKENAKVSGDKKAYEFFCWYKDELNKITQNKEYGFLITKRHLNVHKKNVMPKKFKIGDYTPREITAGEKIIIPLNFTNVEVYFDENPDENLRLVCVKFLTRIDKMVKDAHLQFP